MTRKEALALLARYAPTLKPGRSAIDTLEAEIRRRGHDFGICNETGDWIICEKNGGAILARLA